MPIIQAQLQSTSLKSCSYDPETQELDVRFNNGSLYTYAGVDQATFEGLRDDPSPGSYFHQNIKGKF